MLRLDEVVDGDCKLFRELDELDLRRPVALHLKLITKYSLLSFSKHIAKKISTDCPDWLLQRYYPYTLKSELPERLRSQRGNCNQAEISRLFSVCQ